MKAEAISVPAVTPGTEQLNRALCDVALYHPFYAYILSRLNKVRKPETLTMGVNRNFDLMYDPAFFENNDFTTAEKVDMLRHEIMHIIHHHVTQTPVAAGEATEDGKEPSIEDRINNMFYRKFEHRNWNIAQDIALNQQLPNFPETIKVVNPETGEAHEGETATLKAFNRWLSEAGLPHAEPGKAAGYYYDRLKEMQEKTGEGPQMISFDGHPDDSEDGTPEGEMRKYKIKQLINQAVREMGGLQAGSVPGELVEAIKALNHKPKDWKADLRKFVARNVLTNIEATRNRRNRRMPLPASGIRYEAIPHIVVANDSSGSVPTAYQEQFFAEINALSKHDVQITYIECDADIQKVERWDKPREALELNGRGGTRFKPVFDLTQSKEFERDWGEVDGLIYLSDMENFEGDELKQPKFPVLWARLETVGCDPQYDWGDRTTICIKKD